MPKGLSEASGINPRPVREMNLEIELESERGNERRFTEGATPLRTRCFGKRFQWLVRSAHERQSSEMGIPRASRSSLCEYRPQPPQQRQQPHQNGNNRRELLRRLPSIIQKPSECPWITSGYRSSARRPGNLRLKSLAISSIHRKSRRNIPEHCSAKKAALDVPEGPVPLDPPRLLQ